MHLEIIKAGIMLYPIGTISNIFSRLKFLYKAKKSQQELNAFIQRITDLGYASIFSKNHIFSGMFSGPIFIICGVSHRNFQLLHNTMRY
jgi:hypothetical protein